MKYSDQKIVPGITETALEWCRRLIRPQALLKRQSTPG
jgi:hypothetical protein